MLHRTLAAALLAAGTAAVLSVSGVPASAQRPNVNDPATANRLDCITTFRTLDRNWNGFLEPWEMHPRDARLPTNVSASSVIAEEDFVSRCSGGRMLPQGGNTRN